MDRVRPRDWALLVAQLLIAAVLVRAVWTLSAFPTDDAFIHFRFARNLAFSGEPYFNPGERVMGCSSPLWMALLAAAFRASGHATVEHARVLACASVVLLLFAAGAAVRAATSSRVAGALAGVACALLATPSAALVMETPLAIALLCTAAWAMSTRRYALAGVAMGLAAAARFELFVAAAVALVAVPTFRERVRFAAGFLPVAGTEGLLLLAAYGTIFPNTLHAKSIVYQLDWAVFVLQGEGVWWLFPAAAAVAVGTFLRWRRDARGIGAFTIAALGAAVLATWAARLTLIFPWYWPLVTVPLAVGAACVAAGASGATPERRWTATGLARLLALPAVVALGSPAALAVSDTVHAVRGDLAANESLVPSLRVVSYLEIGSRLAEKCPDAVVMAPEIGALGWAFPGRIVDAVGLVSPEVLRYHPLQVGTERTFGFSGAVPARAVSDLAPDVVVTMETFATDLVWNRAKYPRLSEYVLSATVPVFDPSIPWRTPEEFFGARVNLVLRRAASEACPPF